VQFENNSIGATSYEWTFEGGIPAKSTDKTPTVLFNTGGTKKVSFKAINNFTSITKDTLVVLDQELGAKFTLVPPSPLFEMEVPITFFLKNESTGGTIFKWTMLGANPANALIKEPSITYTEAGSYFVLLEASNGKATRTSQQQITLAADKGFRIYKDIKLGISSAHASVGSFFSSTLGKQFKANDKIEDIEAPNIDLAFLGLDQKFSFMQFVSPSKVADVGFEPIKTASATRFLNNQTLVLAIDFETIDKQKLASLPISKTLEITKFISPTLPQVVLFENSKGKKGAILVKEAKNDGANSYILVDIKVLK
jgi:hypothetical protein